MLKDLLKEGSMYTAANFLTKGISLLLIPFYTSYFSPADYGLYDMLMVFGLFASNIFSLQLNQGLARFVAEPSNSKKSKIEYASTSFLAFCGLMFLFLVLSVLFSDYFIGALSPNSLLEKRTFYLAIGVIFLNNIFHFLNVYLRFIRKVTIVSLLSFLHAVFGVLLLLFFVLKQDLGVDSFFLPYLIIVPLLVIVQLIYLKHQLILFFSNKMFWELTRFSAPLVGGAIALVVMNLTDRLFINEYLGESDLGVYGIGIKFASVIGVVVSGFATALGPLVFEKHNLESTQKNLGDLFKLYVGVGVGGALLLSLFSVELIDQFTSFSYQRASSVLPLMLFTGLFTGMLMFSPGLQIKKKTSVITLLTIVFACMNLVLNYLLIPNYGIQGAALATLISTALYGMFYFKLANRLYYFKFSLVKTSLPFVYSLIVLSVLNFIELKGSVLIILKIATSLLYLVLLVKFNYLNKLKSLFMVK